MSPLYANLKEQRRAENAALDAGTYRPAVDDFGNQYLAPRAATEPGLQAVIDAAKVLSGVAADHYSPNSMEARRWNAAANAFDRAVATLTPTSAPEPGS